MADKLVLEYTRLMCRYMDLLNHMGVGWTPAVSEEFERVRRQAKEMRPLIDALRGCAG